MKAHGPYGGTSESQRYVQFRAAVNQELVNENVGYELDEAGKIQMNASREMVEASAAALATLDAASLSAPAEQLRRSLEKLTFRQLDATNAVKDAVGALQGVLAVRFGGKGGIADNAAKLRAILHPTLGSAVEALSKIEAYRGGIALRARDLAIEGVKKKTSLGVTRSMAYHPEVQHTVADLRLEIEALGQYLDRIADDWSRGVAHGDWWPAKIVAAKYRAVESAKRVVDLALETSGDAGMFKRNELERLYRDVRAGGFHPANAALVHEIVGKTALGIGLGEQPRWG